MPSPASALVDVRNQLYESTAKHWGDTELYNYFWQAENELTTRINCIQTTNTSISTTSGTQEYTIDSDIMKVYQVEWDKVRLKKIDRAEYHYKAGISYGGTETESKPDCYYQWGRKIGFYPVPSEAQQVKLYTYNHPTSINASSTAFSIPEEMTHGLQDYVLFRAFSKDQDERATVHKNLWDEFISITAQSWMESRYDDQLNVVKDVYIDGYGYGFGYGNRGFGTVG